LLDPLDWLDVASFVLTQIRGDSWRVGIPLADFDDWRTKSHPRWRAPARSTDEILAEATPEVGVGSWGLTSLRYASRGLLVSTASGWRLPDDWASATLLRWRLPLGTVHAAAIAARTHAAPQPGVLRVEMPQQLARQLADAGVTDLHVHVGAIVSFDVLFALVLSRLGHEEGILIKDDQSLDVGGVGCSAIEVLSAACLSTMALDCFLATGGNADFEKAVAERAGLGLAAAVAGGRAWEFVAGKDPESVAQGRRYQRLAHFTAALREFSPRLDGSGGQLNHDIVRRKARWLQMAAANASCVGAVEEALRCEAIVHAALTQGANDGLYEFLLRSHRLKLLRKATGTKRTIVAQGLKYLSTGVKLKSAELRTSEQDAGSSTEVRHKMAQSLDEQFRGYEDYMRNVAGQEPVVCWPICLIKPLPASAGQGRERTGDPERPALSVDGGGRFLRFELDELWRTVGVATDLLLRTPLTRQLCPGFDVAGCEPTLPSWCFALMFSECLSTLGSQADAQSEATVSVSFRVHAGESYLSPLEGLRRVDEAVREVIPSEATARIGHGLVLNDPRWSLDQLNSQPRDEAFDDLVWAWKRLDEESTSPAHERLAKFLAETIRRVGPDLFPAPGLEIDPHQYWRAYLARFDRERLADIGVIKSTVEDVGHIRWPSLAKALSNRPGGDVIDGLLFDYLTDTRLNRPVGAPLLDQVRLRHVYELVQSRVLDLLEQRGAIVEACPTSNLVIAGVEGYSGHPMIELIRRNIDVTLSTDDPGLFGTTILDEFALMWPAFARLCPTPAARLKAFKKIRRKGCDLGPDVGEIGTLQAIARTRGQWQSEGLLAPDQALE
jgi:Adenosine deaminase